MLAYGESPSGRDADYLDQKLASAFALIAFPTYSQLLASKFWNSQLERG